MASTKVPVELSSTTGIVDNSNATAITIDSSGRVLIGTTSSLHGSADLQIVGASGNYARVLLVDQDGTNQRGYIDETGGNLVFTSQNGTGHGVIRFSSFNGTDTLERMRVHSDGNVGIGTSSPSYKLEVNSGTSDWPARFISSDDKAGIIIADNDTVNYLVSKNSFLSIGSNSDLHTNNLNVKSSGEVGIKTTTPDFTLDVSPSGGAYSAGDNIMGVFQSPTDHQTALKIKNTNTNASASAPRAALDLDVANHETGSGARLRAQFTVRSLTSGGAGGDTSITVPKDLNFFVNNKGTLNDSSGEQASSSAVAGTQAMRITDAGNVGIGTTSPDSKLHIVDALGGGQLLVANSESDNAEKYGTFGTQHYDVDQEPVLAIAAQSSSSENNVLIGGALGEFNAATSVKFFTAANATTTTGSERMRINSSGNVGIGITNPSQILTLKANTPFIQFAQDGSDSYAGINFGDDDDANDGQILYDHDSRYMRFQVANAERIRVDASGKVGIATTSPTHPLHISKNVSNDTIDETKGLVKFQSSGGNGMIFGTIASSPYTSYIQSAYVVDTSLAQYNIALNPIGGNVGIGTTSPSSKLTIDGSSGAYIRINNAASGDVSSGFQIYNGSNLDTQIYTNPTFGNTTFLSREALAIRTGGAERARIDSAGRFAIGVTNPQDYYATNLVVQGASEGGITIASTSTSVANYLMFADGTSGDARYRGYIGYNHSSDQLAFASAGTQRAFIDSGGRFTFGGNFAHSTYAHTAVFGANSVPLGTVVIEDFDVSSGIGNTVLNLFLRDQDPATNAKFIDFRDGGGRVGSITHNDDGGGVTYNTTSDYRLKENIDYDWDGTTLLKQLKPAKFNFKRAPGRTVQGMLAHEVMDIVPHSVTGDKDHMMEVGTIKDSDNNIVSEEVYEHFCKTDEGQTWTKTGTEPYYQQLDYSRLVPLLTKALQELEAKIETLEAEVKELKGE